MTNERIQKFVCLSVLLLLWWMVCYRPSRTNLRVQTLSRISAFKKYLGIQQRKQRMVQIRMSLFSLFFRSLRNWVPARFEKVKILNKEIDLAEKKRIKTGRSSYQILCDNEILNVPNPQDNFRRRVYLKQ